MAEPMTVGDVARQAIERLQRKDEELRELLSYFETQMANAGEEGVLMSYSDAADKLRAILDGEQ